MTPDLAQRIAHDYKGKCLGGYIVEHLHRYGGTSAVLIGSKNHERVAIKIYEKELFGEDGAELERIRRQDAAKQKTHPNVVKTLGSGTCPVHGYHFLVMDFIDHPTVAEIIKELTGDRIRLIISQTAQAALFIHQSMGLVHRDIKPENVAVRPGDDHVTLLDLGLVRPIQGQTVTDQGVKHIQGTKRYAPPELINGTVEPTNDGWLAVTFYQLGATLYEMLTGKLPYEGLRHESLLEAIRNDTLTIDAPSLPPDLVKLSLDCMVKTPQERRSLVSWKRFFNAPDTTTTLDDLAGLVAALPKKVAHGFSAETREAQQIKNLIAGLSHEIELSIRSFLLASSNLFPEYSVKRLPSDSGTPVMFLVQAEYPGVETPKFVFSYICNEITDARSRSCVCKIFTTTDNQIESPSLQLFENFYQGVFVEAVYRTEVGRALALAVKKVLSVSDE